MTKHVTGETSAFSKKAKGERVKSGGPEQTGFAD